MAETLVSVILEQLVSIARQQLTLVGGVGDDVRKLTSNFRSIRAVLEDAESRQFKDSAVRDWLDKLKEASYDIDDVLDEWNTSIGKLQLKEVRNASKPMIKKVCSPIPCYSFCFRKVILPSAIARKIKSLNKTLDVVATEKNMFSFSLTERTIDIRSPMTTSLIDVPMVHLRDDDKDELFNLLIESSQEPVIPIISIVGMGGIGKTTLARLAFSDKRIKPHFNKMIWVHVSEPFNETRVAKAILESLVKDSSYREIDLLEDILIKVSQSIWRKKFFLVLDDVWTEDPKDWEQLMFALNFGSQGSRILITTRNENVAKTVGATNLIMLGTLLENESWSLFRQIAFSGEVNANFEEIGRKIVDKCKGSSLAIKTLGSLLRFKTNIGEWQSVLDSEMWKIEEVERGIFPPLLLSYYDLSSTLKKCFSYCVIFPKDYEIEKDELIKLWMAQNYLRDEGNKDMELIGEECFKNLAMRSFFQDFKKNKYDGSIESFKMHHIVHEFAQFLTKNECFIANNEFSNTKVDDPKKFPSEFSYEEARHLLIIGNSMPKFVCEKGKLRSIFKSTLTFEIGIDLSKLFDKLTCLRTLDFSGGQIKELSRGIEKLIHLRYLNLSRNINIKELPVGLCELYNLQILDISGCNRLEKLPPGIGKLVNLRHLINHETALTYMPKGIEKLTCLRTLSKFALSNYKDRLKACLLECLGEMQHLGVLIITGLGNVGDVGEVNKTNLKGKEKLSHLGLRFDGSLYVDDQAILKKLEMPQNLKELMIQYYASKTMPLDGLMSLNELKVLKLSFCIEFEQLPSLGKLSSLESLYISNMKGVKRVGKEFLGIERDDTGKSSTFPKLRTLEFEHMSEWKEWEVITELSCLSYLIIGHCPKLEALPDKILQRPTVLQQLEIDFCPILKSRYRKEGPDWLKISHISNIKMDGMHVQRGSS